jgi:hypothetical protein
MAVKDVAQRVRRVAEATLAEQRYVSVIDVLLGLGWLAPSHVDLWRQGRIESLESVLQVNPTKITAAITALERWALDQGLKPSEADYVARTRDRGRLRFSISGDVAIERAYSRHWLSPRLSQRTVERQSSPADLVVIWPLKEWTCTSCGGSGDLLSMEDEGPLCMDCADFGHLDTDYDDLLMSGIDRQIARSQVYDRVDEIVSAWRNGLGTPSGSY